VSKDGSIRVLTDSITVLCCIQNEGD
jgi:hypothetical protein